MKKCSKCKETKKKNYFGINSKSKDGLKHWCKDCWNSYNREYKKRTNKDLLTRRRLKTYKDKASHILRYQISKGKIKRPSNCSKCNKECFPHGHHDDYDKPLDVIWLCQSCHRFLHKGNQI